MLCRRAEMLPDRVHRARLPLRLGVEGVQGHRAPCTARRCRRACRSPTSCPSRCSRRRPRPRSASTTRTSASSRRSTWSARSWPSGPATSASSSTGAARSGPPSAGSSSPTPSSSSASSTASSSLCDEVLTPDSSRFWPADEWKPGTTPPSFDKQPVRDYLDGLDWDKTPPPPPLPDEVVDATQRALRRGLRAHHRPVVRRLAGRRTDRAPSDGVGRRGSRPCADAFRPSRCSCAPGIADPQGATIERSLPHLGFDGVDGVRVGKCIRFDLEAADEAAARARGRRTVRALPHQPGHRGQRRHASTEAASV